MTTTFVALAISTAAIWTAAAGTSYASLFATTGTPTAITSTSATLNGVALTLTASSAFAFQYGTSVSYGKTSKTASIGLGLTAVSTTVTGLEPSTTYHFRLVVLQGSPSDASDYSTGNDVTFTTARAPAVASNYGHASLPTRSLRVRHGVASIPLSCAGTHRQVCKGKVALLIRNSAGKLVECSSSSVNATGGHHRTLRTRISGACKTLLRRAPTHTLSAAVFVALKGTQKLLSSLVTVADSIDLGNPKATADAAHRAG